MMINPNLLNNFSDEKVSLDKLLIILENIKSKITKQEKFRREEVNRLLNNEKYNLNYLLLYTKIQLSFSSHLKKIFLVLIKKINFEINNLKNPLSNKNSKYVYLNNLFEEALLTKNYLDKAINLLEEEINEIKNKKYFKIKSLFSKEDELTLNLENDIKKRNISIYRKLLQDLNVSLSKLFNFLFPKKKFVSLIFLIIISLNITTKAYSQTITTLNIKESQMTTHNEDSSDFINVRSQNALVIIDMQEDYLKLFNKNIRDSLITHQIELIKYANKNKIPIIVFEMQGKGKTIPQLKKYINQGIHKYFSKGDSNGFNITIMKLIFETIGIKKIFVSGINASRCFTDTILGFFFKFIRNSSDESQYRIFSGSNYTADPDWKTQNYNENELKKKLPIFTLKNFKIINSIHELDNYIKTIPNNLQNVQ